MSVNKAIIIGNVGKDPEIRSMQSGDKVASFSLATSESWKDKASGERKEKTEWHRVSVFNQGLIKVVEQYVTKGSRIYIEGQLETRKWTDKDGQEKYTTEIVLRPFRGELTLLGDATKKEKDSSGYETAKKATVPMNSDFDDSEVPF
jgi:single-strand DNA-binding protein